ncbi:MAG: hypothetical protein ACYDD5_00530 [Sulfuricurvum sp.]
MQQALAIYREVLAEQRKNEGRITYLRAMGASQAEVDTALKALLNKPLGS